MFVKRLYSECLTRHYYIILLTWPSLDYQYSFTVFGDMLNQVSGLVKLVQHHWLFYLFSSDGRDRKTPLTH